MAATKERLRILDNQELHDLYGLPRFSFADRCQYFRLLRKEPKDFSYKAIATEIARKQKLEPSETIMIIISIKPTIFICYFLEFPLFLDHAPCKTMQ